MSDLDTVLNESAPAAATEVPATPAPTPTATEPVAAPPVAEPVAPPAPAPSVGRIVAYTEYDDVTCERTHTRAAIVTQVWSGSCVNLTVFDPDGSTRGITSVTLGTGHRSWAWPERV